MKKLNSLKKKNLTNWLSSAEEWYTLPEQGNNGSVLA